MRFKSLLCLLLLLSTHALSSNQVPAGKWRFVDITCSNPKFKFDTDEQSFIDALKNLTFYDEIHVDEQGKGLWVTYMNDRMGSSWARCKGVSPLELSYLAPGKLQMRRGPTTWGTAVSDEQNVSITCGEKEPTGEDEITQWTYEISPSGELLFTWPRSSCGTYLWHWQKQ